MLEILKKNYGPLFIVLISFLIDRITKNLILRHSETHNAIYINDFLNFELVWNTGIGFGLLSLSNVFLQLNHDFNLFNNYLHRIYV